ncbi:MAG TPA: S8 family serine peptidase, partial [Pyrinomonadaceae bacterium]
TVRPNGAENVNAGGKDYYIVQFAAATKDEWLESLREIGAEIVQYVPHQAFFVYADGATASRITTHSRVRWVGRYAADDKLSPELKRFTDGVRGDTAMFDIAVFSRADLEEVAGKISNSFSGRILNTVKLPNNYFNVLRVEMPINELAQIAKIPDVVRIDQYIRPEREDERAAQIVAGNYTGPTSILAPGYNPLTQFGVDGAGVTVSVVDDGVSIPGNGGFYITAANTVDGPLRGATAGASGGHGHINASIIAGNTPFSTLDPTGYNYGIGIAPKTNIINIPFLKSGNTATDAQVIDDTLNTLGPNGVRGTISNNSWGDGTNGNSYDSLAAQYDGFVRDGSLASTIDPFNIIFSAGNSGPGALSLTRPKVAKNVISVANSENIRTEIGGAGADNMDDLRNSSSRGPAADGRIKPDITAPGTVIAGSRAGSGTTVSGIIDANHAWSSGTSHAAPQVAGAAALFTQYWKNTHLGQYPSPSLVKAAILNTAQEMNGLTTNTATIPNGNEGWGRINMKYMLNTGVSMRYINEEIALSNPGTGVGVIGTVADSTKPVRITLVWTDPPGVSNPALVNNLDLQVNVNGTFYRGNVFAGGVSTTGGSGDTLNNVENVFLPAGIPAGSFFSVAVTAVALNGDGILGNADLTDQHYSVVAYNFQPLAPPPNRAADFDGDGRTDVSVFRPASGDWFITNSSNNQFVATQFGASGDIIAPGDYDGDGRTDRAVFRPSNGTWYILRSGGGFVATQFGQNGDVPAAGDYNGDGVTDISVFRPSNGSWYRINSSGGQFVAVQFGASGDKAVPADFDGDNATDIAVWRPSDGVWYQLRSTQGFTAAQFGAGGDKPAQGDHDGDGKDDLAVFRPSDGTWYLLRSTAGFTAVQFGIGSDTPAPGDYDGDGKTDLAVYRDGVWYQLRSTSGFTAVQFGIAGDKPVPAGYLPQ